MENISTTMRVTNAEVMHSLTMISSYLAAKREGSVMDYDRILVADSDAAMVALLMEDAALLLAGRFPGPLLRWRYADAALEFVIGERVDSAALQPALVKAVAAEVLRRWLRISGSEYADAVSASADQLADALKIYFPGWSSEYAGHHTRRASSRSLPPI